MTTIDIGILAVAWLLPSKVFLWGRIMSSQVPYSLMAVYPVWPINFFFGVLFKAAEVM